MGETNAENGAGAGVVNSVEIKSMFDGRRVASWGASEVGWGTGSKRPFHYCIGMWGVSGHVDA